MWRLTVVGLLVAHAAFADPPPPAIDDAIAAAAKANKALVLEFGATWCGPCKQFEKDVLPDSYVQTVLKDVMFVRYDVDVSPGIEAAAKYEVEAYPTFL